MKDNYFLINGKTYVISYKDFKLDIFRLENNQRIELSGIEREYMDSVISRNSSYIYTSVKLEEIVNNNKSINSKEMAPAFIEWLEGFIPADSKDTFYANMENLEIQEVSEMPYKNVTGYYNAKDNIICMYPKENYESEVQYAMTLLHELIHASSTKVNEKGEIVSGFDKVGSDFANSNKGLTDGVVQIITFLGVSQAMVKDIDGMIVDQLSKIVDPTIILESFFSNKGTTDIKNSLDSLGLENTKSEELLTNIEINHWFEPEASQQNILGNIQDTLVEYFIKKVENGLINNTIDMEQLPTIFDEYEETLIDPIKLKLLGKDSECYEGITDSIKKFNSYKKRYTYLVNPEKYNEEGYSISKAGFSTVVLLSLITFIIAIGIIVLGVYLGM